MRSGTGIANGGAALQQSERSASTIPLTQFITVGKRLNVEQGPTIRAECGIAGIARFHCQALNQSVEDRDLPKLPTAGSVGGEHYRSLFGVPDWIVVPPRAIGDASNFAVARVDQPEVLYVAPRTADGDNETSVLGNSRFAERQAAVGEAREKAAEALVATEENEAGMDANVF